MCDWIIYCIITYNVRRYKPKKNTEAEMFYRKERKKNKEEERKESESYFLKYKKKWNDGATNVLEGAKKAKRGNIRDSHSAFIGGTDITRTD
jgi:hypothetical protein